MHIIGVALCLEGSPRIPRLRDELRRVGLADVIHIMLSKRDACDGVRGCFEAHQRALRHVVEHPTCTSETLALIVEDDVEFETQDVFKALEDARRVLVTQTVDIVALGGVPITPLRKIDDHPNIMRAMFQMTHAYVVDIRTAKEIMKWQFVYHKRFFR